jgi:restriction system protein
MAIPDYQSLMLPVLLATPETEIRIGDVIVRLADELKLTPEERAQLLPSGVQALFANRVHWAKFYLSKAGLIESTRRGFFKLTPEGKKVIEAKPARIDNNFLSQFEAFEKFKQRSEAKPSDEEESEPPLLHQTQTPDEIMRGAHRQIDASLAQELLERVRSAPPDFFERLIVNLLLSMGFGGSVSDAGRALGRSGDDGVDGVIDQDPLGLDRVYIQAKRYAAGNNIGSGAIRDFFGSLDRHKASKGLFVTTSSFSPSGIETAQYLSKRIVLIDGDQLAKLMIRYNVGCRVEETLEIKKVDEDYFD